MDRADGASAHPPVPDSHLWGGLAQTQDYNRQHAANPSGKRLMLLQQGLNELLDLLYPPRCGGCGRVDVDWCTGCQHELLAHEMSREPIFADELDGGLATGLYGGVLARAIQTLKYDQYRPLAFALATRLANALHSINWEIDYLAPVPLHDDRLQERGFNQAHLLASGVASTQVIPLLPEGGLRRIRYERPQVGLNRAERVSNVKDSFVAESTIVSGRSILLIDDVCTTGATLGACASALREAGAVQVWAMTVAIARQLT
jgi:competence protein ComFC